jgi:hypothetical protein
MEKVELMGLTPPSGSNASSDSSSSGGSGLDFGSLTQTLDFNDIWKADYDSMSVDEIKTDLISNGDTILYEVEAFYNHFFDPVNGTATVYY